MSSLQYLETIALDWGIRAFGRKHMYDAPIRALRTGEEAVEMMQAFGVPEETVHLLVETVYSRPRGEVHQELGGLCLTTALLARINGGSIENYFLAELLRVLTKSPEHFAKRNQEKIDLGLTV